MPFFTSNGINIFVDRDGQGPAVLMLHGLTLDHRQWDVQRAALRTDFEVFRMDLRGHGRSATTEGGHHYKGLAEDAKRALVQIGIDRRQPGFVVGHSVSADAALQLALDEPRAVKGVVVVTPAVWGQEWSSEWQELMRAMHKEIKQGQLAGALERFRADVIFKGIRARPDLEASVIEMQRNFSGAYFLSHERDHGEPTLERLDRCKTPILVLRAQDDRRDFANTATMIAERAPLARVVDLPGLGHFPNLEDPEAFNKIVAQFISEHS